MRNSKLGTPSTPSFSNVMSASSSACPVGVTHSTSGEVGAVGGVGVGECEVEVGIDADNRAEDSEGRTLHEKQNREVDEVDEVGEVDEGEIDDGGR